MKILKRNAIFSIIGTSTIFAALCSIYFNANNSVLSFLTFLYLITVPGLLIAYSLKIRNIGFWNTLLYSVGLSLFFLMIPGVIFNSIWRSISYIPPLETGLLLIFYGTIIAQLGVIAYFRNPDLEWKLDLHTKIFLNNWYFVIPPVLTILGILSATILNNGGSNLLAIATLLGISLTILLSILLHEKINEHFFPLSIYFYSLSLLLLLSLRSNYVSGWDIQSEFVLFQLTKRLGFWSPANMNDAYNACLSISLLPTIFSRLTSFTDDYIYKLFYQILFAITPVVVYQLYKRYAVSIIGFIAVIYIISQPLFIQPMTALMRQEIAFIFFALMFWVLFNNKLSSVLRSVLFLIFGIGMIVSHYSTTYVTLLLLLTTYLLISIYRITEKVAFLSNIYTQLKLKEKKITYTYFLNPVIILALIWFTLIWYGLINNQLGQVRRVATEGLSRMNELFKSDVTSGESKQALPFSEKNITSNRALDEYTKAQLLLVGGDSYRLYPKKSYINSDVHPLIPTFVSPIVFSAVNKYLINTFEILKQLFKLCVMLSPFYMIVWYFRKDIYPREYIILSAASVVVIVVMTFHPYFGLQYNLSRFYLQLLFFLSLPAIILVIFLFFPLKRFSTVVVGVLVTVLFISLSGLSYHIFGGEARMHLNNFGSDYDKFYTHDEELASGKWFRKSVGQKGILFMDREANLRIYRIISRGFNANVMPALIYQDAYVYASYANIINNRTRIHMGGSILEFNFPIKFLEENKNVIYSNGASKIYK